MEFGVKVSWDDEIPFPTKNGKINHVPASTNQIRLRLFFPPERPAMIVGKSMVHLPYRHRFLKVKTGCESHWCST
jgi:hypothetical protein